MTSRIAFRAALAAIAGLGMVSAAAAAPGLTAGPTFMRSGPGPRYAVVQRVPAGAMVDVLGCTANWCRISWRYRAGYVQAGYVEAGPEGPPGAYPAPVYVEPAPVVVAPFWGPGWGYGYGWGGGGGWHGGWRR